MKCEHPICNNEAVHRVRSKTQINYVINLCEACYIRIFHKEFSNPNREPLP